MGEGGSPLQWLVGLAEYSALEPPVTLQVGGRIFTGFITPLSRWHEQVEGITGAMGDSTLRHLMANASPGPLSEREREEIRNRDPGDEYDRETFDTFCMRDVTVRTDMLAAVQEFPLLVVSCDAVEALSFGLWTPRDEVGEEYPFQAEEDG